MSKITSTPNFANLTNMSDVTRFLQQFASQVVNIVNGQLAFEDNINSSVVTSYFGTSGMAIQIPHGLNGTPIGYVPIQFTKPASIYNGPTLAIGATFVNLVSSASGVTVTLLFF